MICFLQRALPVQAADVEPAILEEAKTVSKGSPWHVSDSLIDTISITIYSAFFSRLLGSSDFSLLGEAGTKLLTAASGPRPPDLLCTVQVVPPAAAPPAQSIPWSELAADRLLLPCSSRGACRR